MSKADKAHRMGFLVHHAERMATARAEQLELKAQLRRRHIYPDSVLNQYWRHVNAVRGAFISKFKGGIPRQAKAGVS